MARSCFSVITPTLLEHEKRRCLKKSRKSNCARYICRAIISSGDYNSWPWGNVKNGKELNDHFTFQHFGLRYKGFLPLLDKMWPANTASSHRSSPLCLDVSFPFKPVSLKSLVAKSDEKCLFRRLGTERYWRSF